MITPPCKDCEERHLGCHSECFKYLEYKNKTDKVRTLRLLNNDARYRNGTHVNERYRWNKT